MYCIFIRCRIDSSTSRSSLLHSRQLDLNEEGSVVDLQALDYGNSLLFIAILHQCSCTDILNTQGNQSVLVYATLMGSLVGWDLRSPTLAWKLDHNLRHGQYPQFSFDR